MYSSLPLSSVMQSKELNLHLHGLQEEQESKAEEEQFPDAAAVERKRAQEAEKWRLQQLTAGSASEDNANFQVCTGK